MQANKYNNTTNFHVAHHHQPVRMLPPTLHGPLQ